MSRAAALLIALAVAVAAPVEARPKRLVRDTLLKVSTPSPVGAAVAHPFVNFKIYFGNTNTGVAADPKTFRAHLGHRDVTAMFLDFVDKGGSGKRARIEPPHVHVGPRAINQLRLTVLSVRIGGKRGRRLRDVDRVRFRAVEGENHVPTADLDPVDVVLPGIPTAFDASGSQDADGDWLTFDWDFGNNDHDSAARAVRTFSDVAEDLTVRVTVSDGQSSASRSDTVLVQPRLDPGRTPGVLRVDGAQALELGAVPLGGSSTATFTVRNLDTKPTSQLKVRLGVDTPDVTLSTPYLDLGPSQSAPVTLTFQPSAPGHQGPNVTLVASASNRFVAHLLGHAFGGAAPGTGPTYAAETLYSNVFARGTFAILPSGQRVNVDNNVNTCQKPDGSGTRDFCAVPSDCATAGESCVVSIFSGLLEPNDMCADGQGNFYLLSDESAYTSPDGDVNKTVSILRLQLDANGNRVGAQMFAHTNAQTMDIACDKRADGRLFVARWEDLPPGPCERDSQEILMGIRRSTGAAADLYGPIDVAELQDPCHGDFDEIGDLEVTRDGNSAFVSFQRDGGVYRIQGPQPTPLEVIQKIDDTFQVHPDGSILYARVEDRRSSSLISLFKFFPEQAAASGPPLLDELQACAVFSIPNNGGQAFLGQVSIAAGRATPGSDDAVVLVSFGTREGTPPHSGDPLTLTRPVLPQGTVVFASPAGNVPCSPLGTINVEQLDPMTF